MFEPTASGAPRSSTTIRTGSVRARARRSGSGHPPPAPALGPGGAQYTPENDVHLLDRLAVLYRYRRLCATVFVLVTAAMIIQGYTNIKIYQAQARVLIDDERSTAVPGLQNEQNSYYEDPEPYFQTQYKILKGRDLTRRVVRKLHLETVPEFNGTKPRRRRRRCRCSAISRRGCRLRPRRAGASRRNRRRSTRPPDESALVGAFIGRVDVAAGPRQPSRRRHVRLGGSEVRRRGGERAGRRVRQPEPRDQAASRRRACSTGSAASSPASSRRSRTASARSPSTASKENALSLDDKQNIVLARLNQLNDAATRGADDARRRRRSLYNQVKAMRRTSVAEAIPVDRDQNPHVQQRKRQARRAAARRRAQLLDATREKHPQVQASTRSIAEAQQQLDLEIARRGADGQERVRDRGARGADVRAEPRGARRSTRQDLEPQEHRLQRDGARGQEQPRRSTSRCCSARRSCASRATAARTTSASSTTPRCRRSPMTPGRPPHLADVGRDRPRRWRSRSPSASTT